MRLLHIRCCKGWHILYITLLVILSPGREVQAHPMPNTLLFLDVYSQVVRAEIRLPVPELELALGKKIQPDARHYLLDNPGKIEGYILSHVLASSPDSQPWAIQLDSIGTSTSDSGISGRYQEIIGYLRLYPPSQHSTRAFSLGYDGIVHQLASHVILVAVRSDWTSGVLGEAPVPVGTIQLDVVNNRVLPLNIVLEEGSLGRGFGAMLRMGMRHIAEGADHLLFLLTLLLAAPLIAKNGRWITFGGTRYGLIQLAKVVTAFTLGHSVTLIAGALNWVRLPSAGVEIAIAASVLVSAIHALRPLFPRHEAWIAGGFGLIHGLAFAQTLDGLHLEPGRMVLSILGFNLGIELVQAGLALIALPVLLFISRTRFYTPIRIAGAGLAGMLALLWILERSRDIASVS